MNENNENSKNKEDVLKRKLMGDSKAQLLALRKEQAEQLAAMRKDKFSLEQELDEIKSSLLVEEGESKSDATPKVRKKTTPKTSKEAVDENAEQPLTEEEKQALAEKERIEKEKEKARLAREKEKEKEKVRRQKEREKEKARLAREKEKEKEKVRRQKEREKEKARLAREKEKEKEKQKRQKEREVEKAKQAETKKLEAETLTTAEDKTKQMPPIETKPIIEEKKQEEIQKPSFERELKFTPRNETEKSEDSNEPIEGKAIIDNLQKLREQILAQKKLERELMEREALKTQQKDRTLMSKLNQLEQLMKVEEEDNAEEEKRTLADDKDKLKKKLEQTNEKLNNLLRMKYENVLVINKKTMSLSDPFMRAITRKTTADLNKSLEKLQNEFDSLQENYQKTKEELKKNNRDLRQHTRVLEENEQLKQQIADMKKQHDAMLAEHASKIEEQKKILDEKLLVADNKTQKAVLDEREKLQLDYDKRLKEKIDDLQKNNRQVIQELKRQHKKEVSLLEDKYEEMLLQQSENKGLAEESLKSINDERQQYLTKIRGLEKEINTLNQQLNEEKQNLLDIETAAKNEVNQLNSDLEAERQRYKNLRQQVEAEQTDLVAKMQNEIDRLTNQIKVYQRKLEESDSEEITKLRKELDKQKELTNHYRSEQDERANEKYQRLEAEFINYKSSLDHYRREIDRQATEKLLHAQEDLSAFKQEYEFKTDELKNRIDELKSEVEHYRRESDKTKQLLDQYKRALAEEKSSHYEIEHKLFKDLDAKEQEVSRLKADIARIPQEAKLDSQINMIAQLVSTLENKSKEKSETTYQPYHFPYPPYFQQDPYRIKPIDFEKELEKRDRIIEDLKREKEERQLALQKEKAQDEAMSFNAKLNQVEMQIKELNDMLKSIPRAAVSEEKRETQAELLRSMTNELEKYKQELTQNINKEIASQKKVVLPATNVQALIDNFNRKKDVLTFQYNNERNKLEIEQKFVTTQQQIDAVNEKLDLLYKQYLLSISDEERKLQKDILALNQTVTPEKPQEKPSEIIVEKQEVVKQEEHEVQETLPLEETTEEPIEKPIVEEQEEIPLDEEIEQPEKIRPYLSPIVDIRPHIVDEPTGFIGSFDQEYLNKRDQIRRLRKMLEAKKTEENLKYDEALDENRQNQEVYIQKIAVVKDKLMLLDKEFKNKKDFSTEREKEFETEKTKLYFELEMRQEQLRKLQEDDLRKLNLRHKTIIKNIDEQLKRLEQEEVDLKEAYVLKRQKAISQKSRTLEMEEKLRQEKAVAKVSDNEGRIIESQEEIKKRKFEEQAVEEKKVEKKPEVVEEKQELPVEEKLEDVQEEISKEVVEVDEKGITDKERKLRDLYQKYSLAEKKMVQDIPEVKLFKDSKLEKLAYEKEQTKLQATLVELKTALKATKDVAETAQLESKITDTQIRLEHLKVRLNHREKQLQSIVNQKYVKEYNKLVDKLQDMELLIKKYVDKRSK